MKPWSTGSLEARPPAVSALCTSWSTSSLLSADSAKIASVCVVASHSFLFVKSLNRSSTSSMTKASSLTIMQVACSSVKRGSNLKPSLVKNSTDRSRSSTARLTKIFRCVSLAIDPSLACVSSHTPSRVGLPPASPAAIVRNESARVCVKFVTILPTALARSDRRRDTQPVAVRDSAPAGNLAGSCDCGREHLDHALLVRGLDLRVERQRERPPAHRLRHRELALDEAVVAPHVRLQVDARDVLRGRDSLATQRGHDGVAIELRSERDDVDEPRALVIGVVRSQRLDLVDAAEQLAVALGRRRPQLEQAIELLELGNPDRGLEIRPAIVEPEPHVVEPAAPGVFASLVPHADDQLPRLLVVGGDDAAFARRDLLVGIEAEDRRHAVAADGNALVLGAKGLRGVLDQRQAVPLRDRAQLVELARVAEDVDRDDRLRARRDRRLDGRRIHVQRARIDVRENGDAALEDEAVRRRRERERGGDDLVPRPDPRDAAEEVQARSAAGDGGRVRRAHALGDEALELPDRRPEREAPGAQHLEDELLLPVVEVGPRERDLARGGPHASAGVRVGVRSSQCGYRSLRPRTTSRYVRWISSVIGPTPISESSTERSGVTSAAVPVMKASSARRRSERMRFSSRTS